MKSLPSDRTDGKNAGDEVVEEEEENIPGPCDAFTHACTNKKLGFGFCDRLLDNFIDKDKKDEYEEIVKNVKQHRPYFSYWLSFVQIVICLISIFAYGMAPIGFSFEQKKGLAITTSLEKELISYPIKQNFWMGPAAVCSMLTLIFFL